MSVTANILRWIGRHLLALLLIVAILIMGRLLWPKIQQFEKAVALDPKNIMNPGKVLRG